MNELPRPEIIVGDCMDVLRDMPAESVHCVVTSPPYWGLRSYKGDEGMIGLEPTLDEHIERLVAVFREVRRVLRKYGTCWINYGDCYAGSGKGQGMNPDKVSNKQKSNAGSFTDPVPLCGYKPKDLMLMPARVALALQADGSDVAAAVAIRRAISNLEYAYEDEVMPDKVRIILEGLEQEFLEAKGDAWWLRSEIVWHKPNPMPESVTDRPTSAHEKVFLFSKSPRYFYDAEGVRQSSNGWNGDFSPRAGERRDGNGKGSTRDQAQPTANLRNVWQIATESYSGAHFATMPQKLVEPCIKAGTSAKGVCSECGAPWVRKVEMTKEYKEFKAINNGWDAEGNEDVDANRHGKGTHFQTVPPKNKTIGWSPSCACDADLSPAVCLDIFGGAGTVGLVAQRLGRRSICIEISPEYADMARQRCEQDRPLTQRRNEQDPNEFELEYTPA